MKAIATPAAQYSPSKFSLLGAQGPSTLHICHTCPRCAAEWHGVIDRCVTFRILFRVHTPWTPLPSPRTFSTSEIGTKFIRQTRLAHHGQAVPCTRERRGGAHKISLITTVLGQQHCTTDLQESLTNKRFSVIIKAPRYRWAPSTFLVQHEAGLKGVLLHRVPLCIYPPKLDNLLNKGSRDCPIAQHIHRGLWHVRDWVSCRSTVSSAHRVEAMQQQPPIRAIPMQHWIQNGYVAAFRKK